MEQARNAYQKITVTPEFRELERLRSLARHNEAAALRHARQEGMEKGVTNVAKNALRMNIPVADIVKMTGLTVEEVERLKKIKN